MIYIAKCQDIKVYLLMVGLLKFSLFSQVSEKEDIDLENVCEAICYSTGKYFHYPEHILDQNWDQTNDTERRGKKKKTSL